MPLVGQTLFYKMFLHYLTFAQFSSFVEHKSKIVPIIFGEMKAALVNDRRNFDKCYQKSRSLVMLTKCPYATH